MKRYLADANILLAMMAERHAHRHLAEAWFRGLEDQLAIARIVQLAVIRLMANRAVMGEGAISPKEGWERIEGLLLDERLELIAEPVGMDGRLARMLASAEDSPNAVTDAYLAAMAIEGGYCLVTFDKGMRRYQGLDLLLLTESVAVRGAPARRRHETR